MNRTHRSIRVALVGLFAGACAYLIHPAFARETAVVLPKPAQDAVASPTATSDTIVFAGGCFWGVEAVFRHVRGVQSAVSGYAGGTRPSPSYEEVSTGTTGHAESVAVRYDPREVRPGTLMQIFMSVAHNPTELNRQGPDHGTQYRSAIFYESPAQQKLAQAYIAQLNGAKVFAAPIVTEVKPLEKFYPAESYHQDYLARHPTQPYIVYNDAPKVEELKQLFPEYYRP